MSIIVKGMEIPESCGRCDFNVSSLYCNRTGSEIDRDYEYSERLSDCPIFELPEKHGRLADADEIRGRMESVFNVSSHLVIGHTWGEVYAGGFSDAIDIVKEVPTIVEAEGYE